MLQEISRTLVPITKNEEASLSWHNSILTVRTDKDILFYEFSYNLHCLDKKIDYISHSISVSKTSPLTGFVPKHFLSEGVSNINYTEMILDPSLWPHNQELVQEMTNIADVQWSPVGLIPNNECALAVLNNIGHIEIYGKGRFGWTVILDLSNVIKERLLSTCQLEAPRTLRELKGVAYKMETGAVAWCPNIENKSCLFATAQKNGNILVWTLQYKNNQMIPELIAEIPTECGELVTITWIPKTSNEFVIVCSNIYGQIYAVDCRRSDVQIDVKSNILWPQKDKMVTKLIRYSVIDEKIVLICNKHRHLLVIVTDKSCQVITQYVRNINDYRITDITSNNNGIFLTSVNCKIYKIMFKVLANDVDFDLTLTEMNDSFSKYELNSIAFSTNNVIWATVMKNRQILHRQRAQKHFELVFFCIPDSQPDELTLLLENPTKKLTNFWDCIEVLRYKTFKTKLLPPISYQEFYPLACKDIYKLKLYHVFLHFFLGIEKQGRNKLRQMLPQMSLTAVKENILAIHASQLITDVHERRKNGEEMLDYLQMETYSGAKKFLDYYCKIYKKDVGEFVNSKELTQQLKYMPKIGDQYTCQSCEDEIHGFTCNSGHFNMFCSLTFTPIDGFEYLLCRNCNSTARMELYSNNPMCTFCDLYLSDGNWQR